MDDMLDVGCSVAALVAALLPRTSRMLAAYANAVLIGALAVFVREHAVLLAVAIAALVGAFMVSYAASIERELGVGSAPMSPRRATLRRWVLAFTAVAPSASLLAGPAHPGLRLLPVVGAVVVIAIGGNVSALRRLVLAVRGASR